MPLNSSNALGKALFDLKLVQLQFTVLDLDAISERPDGKAGITQHLEESPMHKDWQAAVRLYLAPIAGLLAAGILPAQSPPSGNVGANTCTRDKLAITHPANGSSYAEICAKAGRFAAAFCSELCDAFVTQDSKDHDSAFVHLERPMAADFDQFLRADAPGIALQKLKDAADQALTANPQALAAETQALASKAAQAVSNASVATKQVGSTAQSSGSTSLVTKPTTSDLFAIAADSGAFTETSSGSTVTISGTALAIQKLISSSDLYDSRSNADQLRHLTFNASFNISQGSSTSSAVSGPANSATPSSIASVLIPVTNNMSFSAVTAGYKLYRPYDPLSKVFLQSWGKQISDQKDALNKQANTATAAFDKAKSDRKEIDDAMEPQRQIFDNNFKNTRRGTTSDAQIDDGSTFYEFAKGFENYAEAYAKTALEKSPNYASGASTALADIGTLEQTISTIVDTARGCPLLTAFYSYSTPANKPATNDVTVSLDLPFTKSKAAGAAANSNAASTANTCNQTSGKEANNGKSKSVRTPTGWDLTANFYASWYASLPAGAKYRRLRAYQFSAELDKSIGPTAFPRAVWSLGGYGQNQSDKTVLNITSGNLAPGTNITLPSNAQVLLGTSGWIGVAQTKLVFNLVKGMSIPIAAKWSNKTDLLQGSDWRGQFGISYDLSALQKLISPTKSP